MTVNPVIDASRDVFEEEQFTWVASPPESQQRGATALCASPGEAPFASGNRRLGDPTRPAPDSGAAGKLAHAAAITRPLPEFAQFVSLLSQAPGCAGLAMDALRTAAVTRPVDEVADLVEMLGEPPHQPGAAEEAVRAAAAHRPVDDVTRLVSVLNASPNCPSALEEAVLTAAATRPVEELAQLATSLQMEGVTLDPPPAPDYDPIIPMDEDEEQDDDQQPRRRSWFHRP